MIFYKKKEKSCVNLKYFLYFYYQLTNNINRTKLIGSLFNLIRVSEYMDNVSETQKSIIVKFSII